jgi:hypothetical protein
MFSVSRNPLKALLMILDDLVKASILNFKMAASQDIVYMPMYMVNVPQNMLKAYMGIVNSPQGILNVSMDMLQVS